MTTNQETSGTEGVDVGENPKKEPNSKINPEQGVRFFAFLYSDTYSLIVEILS